MKKVLFLTILMIYNLSVSAKDVVFVKQEQVPILIEREDNVLFLMKILSSSDKKLNTLSFQFDDNVALNHIKSLKLYYGGTAAIQDSSSSAMSPVNYLSSHGKTLSANKSYSLLLAKTGKISKKITFTPDKPLFDGINYFWISIEMNKKASLYDIIKAELTEAVISGENVEILKVGKSDVRRRMAVGVAHSGDFGSNSFRIPGLVTSKKGTLLGVFDIRYNSSKDLQEKIDIGLRRSKDGGRTWGKLQIPMSFGEYGGLPSAQNGVGDPSILVDDTNGNIWIIAAWCHGMGNQMAWWSSHPGMDKNTTAQLVLTVSKDDGKTWSEPINITDQVKQPSWYFLLQGPGRGITMHDGTLVFPIQYIREDRIPVSGIMFSKDHGKTWKINNPAHFNTTESQVAEISPGILMLNMRDNRGGSRSVYTTSDLGETWKEHPSSRSALPESVCQAGLLKIKAEDNITGKDLLVFSNPDVTKGRNHTTIKVSSDNGTTWKKENMLLIDENENWGYSCLTLIDRETIGILYESSVAHITFQAIKIKDILNN